MSLIDLLIQAAQVIEQQDINPQTTAGIDQRFTNSISIHSSSAGSGVPFEHNNNRHHFNHNQNSIRDGNSSRLVSSSAPTAGATFLNANGLTISSAGGGKHKQQHNQLLTGTNTTTALISTNHISNNEYELTNGNISHAIIVTANSAKIGAGTGIADATISDRSSEGCMSEDAFSSSSDSSPSQFLNHIENLNSNSIVTQAQTEILQQTNEHNKISMKQMQQQLLQQVNGVQNIINVDNRQQNAAAAAASKQMLLNGGTRIAAPSAIFGLKGGNSHSITQQHSVKLLSTDTDRVANMNALSVPSNYKVSGITLTPPPAASRKFIEPTQPRIRSFSLSSHKISANQQYSLHNGSSSSNSSGSGSGSGNSNQMCVDEAHMSYLPAHGASSNHSPPRSGNHYMQLMTSAQTSATASQVMHVTPPNVGSGRRRTISSNSNGAGTREVHNKLEKNRRAHLKKCYEDLKNELSLKDEDRKKTSNLAILSEAEKTVKELLKTDQEQGAELERFAKEKIMLKKQKANLMRELGPRFEHILQDSTMQETDLSILTEKDNHNDSVSLSSGRGSMLYSSTSSLSSGGSVGSNTMSSPIGAGLPTAIPTVISKINSTASSNSAATSPISPNMLQHYKAVNSNISSTSASNSPNSSPTAGLPVGIVGSSSPISLTSKNMLIRGNASPSPSTPSPPPCSSSGVSSASSSSPINGVITGRAVTVNIPNGLKIQNSLSGTAAGLINGTLANGATTATIITTASAVAGGNTGNNAYAQSYSTNLPNATASTEATAAPATSNISISNSRQSSSNRKRTYSHNIVDANAVHSSSKTSEQESVQQQKQQTTGKMMKLYNGLVLGENNNNSNNNSSSKTQNIKTMTVPLPLPVSTPASVSVSMSAPLTMSIKQNGYQNIIATGNNNVPQFQLSHIVTTKSNQSIRNTTAATASIVDSNSITVAATSTQQNGIKLQGSHYVDASTNAAATAAAAFYQANSKLALMNGSTAGTVGGNGITLKDATAASSVGGGAAVLSPVLITTTSANSAAAAALNGNAGNSATTLYSGNLAQIIAASTLVSAANSNQNSCVTVTSVPFSRAAATHERINGKVNVSIGAQALLR